MKVKTTTEGKGVEVDEGGGKGGGGEKKQRYSDKGMESSEKILEFLCLGVKKNKSYIFEQLKANLAAKF